MKSNISGREKKWNVRNFPFDDGTLTPIVQEKAVEIANRLYEEGMSEGKALYERAVKEAKEWFLEMEG
ncbi:hypothetical protein [Olivibacter sp. XZL3]|uniref:hypothetical protein n=1 Tax=Olivibacter sp. XZL3 TaxID=1735116 RepID=UPI001065AAA1|nr:hypothetical protein [Olivibacter sp. XZL3]